MKYEHQLIEKKWQMKWDTESLYSAADMKDIENPFYNLFMFPYPSAEGLHAGHAFSSTGSDIYGRFMRMHGKTVFQPMGYDSFGIHSENYAIKVGQTPQFMLSRTTKHFEEQLRSLGHGYDWKRTVTTSDPDYYKWTQWLFTLCFKAGLAYRKEAKVNWCPSCKTVLSDEQVIDGKCERCGTVVERKDLTQWFLSITKYADRLLNNLENIEWPSKIKQAQKQWIGKGEGLEIKFSNIAVWTTYWETIFGATFLVVSPEYLLSKLAPDVSVESIRYAEHALEKSADERRTNRKKTGENTGLTVLNPATKDQIPVYVADYVIEGVGTGAVMGVPAHDSRDFEFAKKFNLPIVPVVSYANSEINQSIKKNERSSEEPGALTNSGDFNGLSSNGEGKDAVRKWLVEQRLAEPQTNYHLRDWLISRQRYWGAPIPMVFCETCAQKGDGEVKSGTWNAAGWYTVSEENLPVLLPEITDYKPKGEGKGPLANHKEFYETVCPKCGEKAERETDVMDTFVDSSWYYLRYPTVGLSNSSEVPFDLEVTKKWLPVDLYFGGAEHSVLHLLYARFMNQVLFDQKKVSFEEPFPHLYAHGLMIKDGAKMSKSKGNVVNPDEYITKFGADTLRLYIMFLGPMDGSPDFRDTGIEGMQRFTNRVWDLLNDVNRGVSKKDVSAIVSKMHQTVKKVTDDINVFHYNTAISGLMEFVNELKDSEIGDDKETWKEALKTLTTLLAPFTPHLTEEVWREVLNESGSVHTAPWPMHDESKIIPDQIVVAVQINGKLRGQIEISKEESENEEKVTLKAKVDEQVAKWLEDKSIRKTIYVKGKIVNFVV